MYIYAHTPKPGISTGFGSGTNGHLLSFVRSKGITTRLFYH